MESWGTGFVTRRDLTCPVTGAPVTADFVGVGDSESGSPVDVAWCSAPPYRHEIACGKACVRPDAFRPAA